MVVNLVKIVEDNLESMRDEWIQEATNSEILKHYNSFGEEEVRKRGNQVFENLVKWLKSGASHEEVKHYFEEVGEIRFKEEFPLTEVHYALYLTKKVFWNHIDWRDAITGKFESSRATQIMNTFNNYFDLGNFHITQGYLNALFSKVDDNTKFSKEELKALLMTGIQDFEGINDDDIIYRPV